MIIGSDIYPGRCQSCRQQRHNLLDGVCTACRETIARRRAQRWAAARHPAPARSETQSHDPAHA
jgi:hypothetical protein